MYEVIQKKIAEKSVRYLKLYSAALELMMLSEPVVSTQITALCAKGRVEIEDSMFFLPNWNPDRLRHANCFSNAREMYEKGKIHVVQARLRELLSGFLRRLGYSSSSTSTSPFTWLTGIHKNGSSAPSDSADLVHRPGSGLSEDVRLYEPMLVKGLFRCYEKMLFCVEPGFEQFDLQPCLDVVRGALVCHTLQAFHDCLESLLAEPTIEVVR